MNNHKCLSDGFRIFTLPKAKSTVLEWGWVGGGGTGAGQTSLEQVGLLQKHLQGHLELVA